MSAPGEAWTSFASPSSKNTLHHFTISRLMVSTIGVPTVWSHQVPSVSRDGNSREGHDVNGVRGTMSWMPTVVWSQAAMRENVRASSS